jgi:hypothetical protein
VTRADFAAISRFTVCARAVQEPPAMEPVSPDASRELMAVVEAYRRAERSFESRGRGLSIAELHVRGEIIASSSRSLATDAPPMQGYWATVLGRSIDEFLDDATSRAHRALFEPLDYLRGRRRPEPVARAAAILLARITEALTL